MNIMGAQAVLAVLLLAIGSVEAADGGVNFWRTEVTLTCPKDGEWKWFQDGKLLPDQSEQTYKHVDSDDSFNIKGEYHCEYKDKNNKEIKYYFYVQGKGCTNCFELDAELFLVAIVVDLIFTAFLMIIIYRCTKKNNSPAAVPQSSKATPRPGGRVPSAPASSSAYESLTPHTRGQETYSHLNRTG